LYLNKTCFLAVRIINDLFSCEQFIRNKANKAEHKRLNRMLVLTRKLGESIAIDDHIKIVVVQIKGKQVRLGIKAPKETKIHREEVYQAIQDQNTEAAQSTPSDLARLNEALKEK
jgi:carbon storage regulator